MVQRTACSTGEESKPARSVSCAVGSVVRRDGNFGHSETEGSLEKFRQSGVGKSPESSNPETSGDDTIGETVAIGGRFSLFKWFKRGSREAGSSWDRRKGEKCLSLREAHRRSPDLSENAITSGLSRTSSVETLYSTATVRSFAFQTGALEGAGAYDDDRLKRYVGEPFARNCSNNTSRSVGPFGVGASKIVTRPDTGCVDVTKTLPANVLSKRLDVTARYSLQPCHGLTGGFGSCGNFVGHGERLIEIPRRFQDRRGIRVHVQGKRRAPKPPVVLPVAKKAGEEPVKIGSSKRRGKRRQAPKPPEARPGSSFSSPEKSTSRKVAESADKTVQRLTESAIQSVNKVTETASLPDEKCSGSVNLVVNERTGSPCYGARHNPEIGSSAEKTGPESAILPGNKNSGNEVLGTNDRTSSANLATKNVTEPSVLPVSEKTASDIFQAPRQCKDSDLPENQKVISRKEMNVGETHIEEPKKFQGKCTRVTTSGEFHSSPIFSKKFFTASNNAVGSQISTTLQTNLPAIDKEVDEEGKVKRPNSRTPRPTSHDADVKTVNALNTSSTFLEDRTKNAELTGSISNDSLVLRGGVLHSKRNINGSLTSGLTLDNPSVETNYLSRAKGRISDTTGSQTSTTAMPRPWYKRNVFETARDSGTSRRSDVSRTPAQPEVRDDKVMDASVPSAASTKYRSVERQQDGGTLSRLNFFHRGEKLSDERKKENKRKSGLSMLANISELDKEAAAIVEEEQARIRATAMFSRASRSNEAKITSAETEDVVQEMVTSAMENSPKRGTRALISKFNAISNITKVTVNTSFFVKNPYPRDSRDDKNLREINAREKLKFLKTETVRTDRDLSGYFLPAQKLTTNKRSDDVGAMSSEQPTSKNSKNDVPVKSSFFHGVSGKGKIDSKLRENLLSAKDCETKADGLGQAENDPNSGSIEKFSRLRVNVAKGESTKSQQPEFCDVREKKVPESKSNGETHESIVEKNGVIGEKEFSKIFRATEKQSSTGKQSSEKCLRTGKKTESFTSSQVSRVLDILVEAEKRDRLKINHPKENGPSECLEIFQDNNKPKISLTSAPVEHPMKTDLKEMLKEMKHSLPKRPKPKKICGQPILPNGDEKPLRDEKQKAISTNDKKNAFFLASNENSASLSPVTVLYPPPIRIGPKAEKSVQPICRGNGQREYDRHKVSSAAQTSGNLKKLPSQYGDANEKLSKWNSGDVVYLTSDKRVATPGTSGLTKNTFQLIRPREFAQIEAMKTMKKSSTENIYANVIEQSLYANALVPAMETNDPKTSSNEETTISALGEKKLPDYGRETVEMRTTDSRNNEPQNMNTLAVNRLLRKLEAAIASGHHQQAAGLAKELARLKIHCSVVRQRTKPKDLINVNMYIEDKLAHQGPIPLRLARSLTVAELKTKIFTEFEIPTNVQRWIVGKNLADNDSVKLEELNAAEGSPVFLYLVAPELNANETPSRDNKLPAAEKDPPLNNPELQTIDEIPNLVELIEPEKLPTDSQAMKEEDREECISEDVRMERYEALIQLENCDVIPNSEPIECPICFVTYGPQEGVILRDCLHMFCRSCIANTIRYCDEAEVKCPFRDTEYTCDSTLQEREIKALVEPEVYQQHLAKSIAQAENNAGNNAFHCKSPDCPGWCIYDDNVNNFLCPVCGVNNCLTCQVVHTGKNCRQYQEELRLSQETDQESKRTAAMLEEMVDRGEALACPTCAVVLMKKWGCDWLRCSMCKTEICWVTRGPRWGPGGKGDTSGGCRCGEKGVKCHPRCNYCH